MATVRRRDAERSRNAILNAAEAAFAERGYDGTTFSDICSQAGVSRGLPIHLFGSKEELYLAVVDRAARNLRNTVIEPLRAAAAKTSLEKALEQAVTTYLRYLAGNPRIVRLLQWEMLAANREDRPYAPSTEIFQEILEIIGPVFKRAGYAKADARYALASLVSLCFFPFMSDFSARALGFSSIREANVPKRARAITRLLRKGLLS